MTDPIKLPSAVKAALSLLLSGWTAAEAGTYTVAMTPYLTFEPSYLQIQLGDTVVWTNEDTINQHDTTSTEGFWSSPLLDYGQTYSLTFPITGAFPYQDSFYGEAGMTGTVVVLPAPTGPLLVLPTLQPNQSFEFTVTNLVAGQTNIIQVSTNLPVWSSLHTNVTANSGYTYVDTTAAASRRRFYRVLALP